MADSKDTIEPIISLLFWAVVIGASVLYSATKKKRQAREVEETQEQLLRVDEAIRVARARAARRGAPAALPVEASPEAPVRSGARDAARGGDFWRQAEQHEGPARPGAFEAQRLKPQGEAGATPAGAGFRPPSLVELREALVWREIFGPCPGRRP